MLCCKKKINLFETFIGRGLKNRSWSAAVGKIKRFECSKIKIEIKIAQFYCPLSQSAYDVQNPVSTSILYY